MPDELPKVLLPIFRTIFEKLNVLGRQERAEQAGAVQAILFADLPIAGKPGRLLLIKDALKPDATPGLLVYDDGTNWISVCDCATINAPDPFIVMLGTNYGYKLFRREVKDLATSTEWVEVADYNLLDPDGTLLGGMIQFHPNNRNNVIVSNGPANFQGDSTFIRSIDAGLTWSVIRMIEPQFSNEVYGIYPDPSDSTGQTWWALVSDYAVPEIKLMKSTDNGDTWTLIDSVTSNSGYAYGVAISPNGQKISWSYVLEGAPRKFRIRYSNDGGSTWAQVYEVDEANDNLIHDIKYARSGGDRVLATYYDPTPVPDRRAIVESIDGGATWSVLEVDAVAPFSSSGYLLAQPDKAFVTSGIPGTNNAPQRSSDSGVAFVELPGPANWAGFGDGDSAVVEPLRSTLLTFIFENSQYKISKSTDNGQTWETVALNGRFEGNVDPEGIAAAIL